MDSSIKNLSLHKVKALLYSPIIADMMATGRKVKCMGMVSSHGMMDLLIKGSISTVANMAKALSSSPRRNITEANGFMVNKMARALYTTGKVM